MEIKLIFLTESTVACVTFELDHSTPNLNLCQWYLSQMLGLEKIWKQILQLGLMSQKCLKSKWKVWETVEILKVRFSLMSWDNLWEYLTMLILFHYMMALKTNLCKACRRLINIERKEMPEPFTCTVPFISSSFFNVICHLPQQVSWYIPPLCPVYFWWFL